MSSLYQMVAIVVGLIISLYSFWLALEAQTLGESGIPACQ